MPTESLIPPPTPPAQSPDVEFATFNPGILKCSLCGVNGLASSPIRPSASTGAYSDESMDRLCGGCERALDIRRRMDEAIAEEGDQLGLGLGLRGISLQEAGSRSTVWAERGATPTNRASVRDSSTTPPTGSDEHEVLASLPPHTHDVSSTQSIPAWQSASPLAQTSSNTSAPKQEDNIVPNRLLDIARTRVNNKGKGALYPGAVFKGTQTSGRSAYEVEVKIADVNLAESSVSGYLSIQHLTESHPQLTTFFTGEIIGQEYGFQTGERFGATENDDFRHWNRFEQFRRPTTRGDIVPPQLFFRDPQPDKSRGETRARDRDFMFLRIKERFLVPDHRVRDISGASFAGFYYAMIDFSPDRREPEPEAPLVSPTSPRAAPLSPPIAGRRRTSTSGGNMGPIYRRQSSSDNTRHAKSPGARDVPRSSGEATIRGYYFHALNQEPFQELFLTHVPTRSLSTFEMR